MPKNVREKKLYLYGKLFLEDDNFGDVTGEDPNAAPPVDPSGDPAAMGQDPNAAPPPAAPAPTDPSAGMTPPPGMKVVFVPDDVLSMYDQNVQTTGDPNAGLTNPAAGDIAQPVDPSMVAQTPEEQEVLEAFRLWKKDKIKERSLDLFKRI